MLAPKSVRGRTECILLLRRTSFEPEPIFTRVLTTHSVADILESNCAHELKARVCTSPVMLHIFVLHLPFRASAKMLMAGLIIEEVVGQRAFVFFSFLIFVFPASEGWQARFGTRMEAFGKGLQKKQQQQVDGAGGASRDVPSCKARRTKARWKTF